MKNSHMWTLIALSFAISIVVNASPTSKEEALRIAQQYNTNILGGGLRDGSELNLVYTETGKLKSSKIIPCFYVFNISNDGGFVIVSGDNSVKSVLGYSKNGSFSANNIPVNIKTWFENYKKEIIGVVSTPELLINYQPLNDVKSSLRSANSSVSPLLGNIKWNQDSPYNLQCPLSTTYSERTVTGCIATALAQIMKYYQWPVTGVGTKSYTFDLDGVQTSLSANFGTTTYDWANLLDTYGPSANSTQKDAVALLSYHAGVAVEMDFGTASQGGSGATITDAGKALKNYFNYDPDLQTYNQNYFEQTSWSQKLMEEINAGRPVLYTGSSDEGGHAFVFDGYDDNGLFHINWGWGGYSNGYFEVTSLNPDYPGIGSSAGGYTQGQVAIFGIQKNDGINNASYNICASTTAFTSSKSNIGNINTESFNATFGLTNYGINTFSGKISLAIYKNGLFVKAFNEVSLSSLPSYSYMPSYTFNGVSLNGVDPGLYKLYLVYKPAGSTDWNIIYGNETFNNHLVVSITGNSAVISVPVSGNSTPVANAGPDQQVFEGATVTLNGSNSSDLDGNPLTYLWSAPSGIVLSSLTAIQPTFTAPLVSSDTQYTFSLIVNDGTVNSLADDVIITVKNSNTAPVANAGPNQTINEGETVTLNGTSSSDADGNALTYLWTAPTGVVLSSLTVSSPTFVAPDVLSDTQYTFSLVVNDGSANSEVDQITVTVKQVNKVPVANAGPNQTVNEGETITLNGTSSIDPDGDALTYLWTAPTGIVLSSVTASSPTFVAPEVLSDTQYTFSLVVNDGAANSDADQITVTIKQVNKTPLANAGPNQAVNEGETVTLNGTLSIDPESDALTYLWTAPTGIVLSSVTVSSPTFVAPEVLSDTQYTFSLVVNDGSANSEADQITVTVKQVNKAPIANAGPNQAVNEGETITLNGTSSSDSDGDALTYLWAAPTGIVLSSVTASSPTFVAPEVFSDTQYTFSLVVNDGTANSEADQVIVTIKQVNKVPVANAGPNQTVNEGETVTLNGTSSSEPDGDVLTYLWTAPTGIVLSSVTSSSPTFIAPDVLSDTQYTFSLVVNDGTANSEADQITVTIKQVNKVPVANAGPGQTVNEGETVTLNGASSSDPDGDALTYLWTAPTGIVLSSVTSSSPTFVAPDVLSDTQYTFSLVVNDGTANSTAKQVVILVKFVVGLKPVSENGDVRVYPNPVLNNVYINFSNKPEQENKISVFDIAGIEILKQKSSLKETSLDFSNFPAGLYFIRIDNKTYKVNKK